MKSNRRCLKCDRPLTCTGGTVTERFRLEFFDCLDCRKLYVLETNSNGESEFYEEE